MKGIAGDDKCVDPPKNAGPACLSTPHPINIATGNKWLSEQDLEIGALRLRRYYNSDPNTVDSMFGARWSGDYTQRLSVQSTMVAAHRSEGKAFAFAVSGSTLVPDGDVPFRLYRETDASGNVIGYRLDATDGTIEKYDSAGRLLSITDTRGQKSSLTYDADNSLLKVSDDASGRELRFTYDSYRRVIALRDSMERQVFYAYDGNGNLATVSYPDGRTRSYYYNESAYTGGASLPNALTGVQDENGSRFATYTYDSSGRAVSESLAGNAASYQLSFNGSSTTVTDPAGVPREYSFQTVLSVPHDAGRSSPAGSGCGASSSAATYDAAGNVLSRDDFQGSRTCYAYDSRNRETVRVEGLTNSISCSSAMGGATLPAGARRVTTSWHPDWQLPTVVTEPLKQTTIVYHGQPDPFNGNATANCTSAPNRADGKPAPVVCKRVEQALLPAGSSGGALADGNFDKVVVLLHAEGTNGSTSVVDSSATPRTISVVGSGVSISTAASKYGSGSIGFAGSGNLSFADGASTHFGTGDFTIELWYYQTDTAGYGLISNRPAAASGWALQNNSLRAYYNGVWSDAKITWPVPAANTWHHIALVRDQSTMRVFVDGIQQGASAISGSWSDGATSTVVLGAATNTAENRLIGNLDEVRITNGVARYTANFTPPAQAFSDQGPTVRVADTTVPAQIGTYTYDAAGRLLTATDPRNHSTAYAYYAGTAFSGTYDGYFQNVTLLLHGDVHGGSNAIADSSRSVHAMTTAGAAAISAAQSKFGGASLKFGGASTDYILTPDSVTPNSADFDFGSYDFTIEAWVYIAANSPADNDGTRGAAIVSTWNSGSSLSGWILGVLGNTTATGTGLQLDSWNAGAATLYRATVTISQSGWHHIAGTAQGGTRRLFLDGIQVTGTTTTLGTGYTQFNSLGNALRVGGTANAGYPLPFNGYVDDLRITKGVARYTANFTPPAAPFADTGPDMNALGHTAGDLQSVTNAAGQVTQYTLYDPAGRLRQMVDSKGIPTDIAYTPRGWVSTVTVTPPGGSARTTSYTYDGVGQMTAVSLPDGTSLAYSYDAAHRLTGVTDTQGNSVTYTLDAAGNRTGEDLRDAGGALRRSIARSFDALNRLQQVTGAAQ